MIQVIVSIIRTQYHNFPGNDLVHLDFIILLKFVTICFCFTPLNYTLTIRLYN